MGSRRTQQVVVRMPVGMLKAVRAHARRDGLPVTAIMLRVLESAGYGCYEPVRGRPRGGSSPQGVARSAKTRSMIKTSVMSGCPELMLSPPSGPRLLERAGPIRIGALVAIKADTAKAGRWTTDLNELLERNAAQPARTCRPDRRHGRTAQASA
jgi:hypothetical protein